MKKILVTQSSMPNYDDYCNEIKSIWDTVHLTNNGPKHQELENNLKEYLGVQHLSLFTNGHLALYLAIKSLNLTGEVITTPFTFVSTTNAIVENGLTPVFCDINPYTYTIDPAKIEALITEKTTAIIPVHVYGNCCNVEEIEKIAKKHNLKVIYDAAHVFGVKYKNKSIFRYGDLSMASFHATKVFNTIEGGAVFYSNELEDKFNSLKNFGLEQDGNVQIESINAKMNEFQACMGLLNLKNIEIEINKRKVVYDLYCEKLKDVKGIQLPSISKDVEFNYAYLPVIFNKDEYGLDRNEVCNLLNKYDIFPRKYFYPITSEFNYYKNNYVIQETPIAKKISENVLCLPLYADLTIEDVDRICDLIIKKEGA